MGLVEPFCASASHRASSFSGMVRRAHRYGVACGLAILLSSEVATAEPTEPVIIGWWAYFDPVGTKTASGGNPGHPIDRFGDEDTYYYEPSGGHGLHEDLAYKKRSERRRRSAATQSKPTS